MEFVPLDVARDAASVANVVSRSMRASYALSPDQIDAVVDEEFAEAALAGKADREDVVMLVARGEGDAGGGPAGAADETGDGTEVAEPGEGKPVEGFAEGEFGDDGAVIRWLHVDPEARGAGVGTALFERLTDAFDERDARTVRSNVLAEDVEGGTFCEQFGFVRVDRADVEFGDLSLVAEVYASPNAVDPAETEGFDPLAEGEEPPERAEAPDGTEVFVDPEDPLSGTIAPFFAAFESAEFEARHGYFCGACRTVTTEVDQQDRVVCPACGNRHRPSDWDGSYL
ncbi:GNAT family N-acetyltransferase [Halorarum halobium]|uniref:GNAT family N-acetyltransferase n=1 Tax=Halorarum halobium TaxID=3075121 RepID=UPI0028ACCD44|nr:GNAT family N-acetyltransferase [Halobaculum sp. XH14]